MLHDLAQTRVFVLKCLATRPSNFLISADAFSHSKLRYAVPRDRPQHDGKLLHATSDEQDSIASASAKARASEACPGQAK